MAKKKPKSVFAATRKTGVAGGLAAGGISTSRVRMPKGVRSRKRGAMTARGRKVSLRNLQKKAPKGVKIRGGGGG